MSEASGEPSGCLVSCEGLYADIHHFNDTGAYDGSQQLISLLKDYSLLKEQVAKSLVFDQDSLTLSKHLLKTLIIASLLIREA